jgi:hypothetical protein
MTNHVFRDSTAAAVRTALGLASEPGIADAEQHRRSSRMIQDVLSAGTWTGSAMWALSSDILHHARAVPESPEWADLNDDILSVQESFALDVLLDRPLTPGAYLNALDGYLRSHVADFTDDEVHVLAVTGLVELALTLRALAALDRPTDD